MADADAQAPDTWESVSGAGDARAAGEVRVTPARPVHPYLHVVVIALVGALVVLGWLAVYEAGLALLWQNDLVLANPWLAPAIVLPFSLLAGLLVRYRKAPTTLDESLIDSLSGDTAHVDWRSLPVNVLMAWASLFSGAVLGPEGGIGGIATKIAAFYADKVGLPPEARRAVTFSTIASGYNGLIANPLFTAVLGTEVIKDADLRARTLPANLIGGAIGFLVFTGLGIAGAGSILDLGPIPALDTGDAVLVVLMAVLGMVTALLTAVLMRVSAALFGRFGDRVVLRSLAAGVVFSVVGIVAPVLLFSGEGQVQAVADAAPGYGAAALVGMAVAKLALLAIAFKSGFLGGPTFPAIFAAVCLAEAVGLWFPGVSVHVAAAGLLAGLLMMLFRAPFMVVLLTAVVLQATPELTALIVLSVATVLIVQPYVLAAITARRAARAGAAPPPAA